MRHNLTGRKLSEIRLPRLSVAKDKHRHAYGDLQGIVSKSGICSKAKISYKRIRSVL